VPAAVARLPEALRARIRVAQQVPGGVLDQVQADYRQCGVAADLAGFFDDMPARLARAHLVICRAGASTVAELASARRPAILVPFPHATDDHQTANARALVDVEAGWLIPEAELTPEVLAGRLESLLNTPTRLETAAARAGEMAPGDAASRLADLVCASANDNGDEADQDTDKDRAPPPNPKEAAA